MITWRWRNDLELNVLQLFNQGESRDWITKRDFYWSHDIRRFTWYICRCPSGSFSDNFNFSMKKASRTYNFCFISKRRVVFNWQSVGQIKTRLNAQKYTKKRNKFISWLFKCLNFLPSRFTVLVSHSITSIMLPLSKIIICFKLSYPWKQTTE